MMITMMMMMMMMIIIIIMITITTTVTLTVTITINSSPVAFHLLLQWDTIGKELKQPRHVRQRPGKRQFKVTLYLSCREGSCSKKYTQCGASTS